MNVVIRFLCFWSLCAGVLCGNTKFERPVPEDGGPTKIYCVTAVLDVDEINDANQNFTVNLFTKIWWNDPREAHAGPGNVLKQRDELWTPRLIFLNRQKLWASFDQQVEIQPNGDVIFRNQFWGDFSQPMNLHDFPFDEQSFEIRVVSSGSEGGGEVSLLPDPNQESFVADKYSVADWRIVGSEVDNDDVVFPAGARAESFAFRFKAKRLPGHFLIKVVAPLLMIVVLSWVVFWLDPSQGASQLGVAVTSFLTVIAYHVALGSKLPEIPYLTRLDVFVFGSTLLVFLAMIEVVVSTGLAQREGGEQRALKLDRICRVIFPSGLVVVALYAFMWH